MAPKIHIYNYDGANSFHLSKWKIRVGSTLYYNSPILSYKQEENLKSDLKEPLLKYKSNIGGTVTELLVSEGDLVESGTPLLKIEPCTHPVIMKDLCAECGTDLRNLDPDNFENITAAATFSMVHVVPELKVCKEQAEKLSQDDEDRLLKNEKLVLLVDLDQTLIHTTNDMVPEDMPEVVHFQLYGQFSPWYHTKLRPGTKDFLEKISKYYELHICTFGARLYAHKIAEILDPKGKYFSHRILSRDECFDPTSKTANLKALFPKGDHMVCIIDDREDVWNFAPNVIHVKPYTFFRNTGDINAPLVPSAETSSEKLVNTDKADSNKVPLNDVELKTTEEKEEEKLLKTQKSNVSEAKDSETSYNEMVKLKMEAIAKCCKNVKVILSETRKDTKENVKAETKNELIPSTEGSTDEDKTDSKKLTGSDNSPPESEEKTNGKKETDKKPVFEIIETDDYLLYLEEILMSVHKAYYNLFKKRKEAGENFIPDLKKVVPDLHKKVLKNVNIVFSSIVPTNYDPEHHHFWLLAESLGATVHKNLVLDSSKQRTTHLIALRSNTSKVNAARLHDKIWIVTLDWLLCCEERWERADERLFLLPKDTTEEDEINEILLKKHNRPKRPRDSDKKQDKIEEEKFSERVFAEAGLALSQDEIEDMDREIEQACSEESECSQESNGSSESSSVESLSSGDYPKGWRKRRKRNALEEMILEAVNSESSDAETIGSVDEEMAEAVKQEFQNR